MTRVAMIGGGISRFDVHRREVAEELVAQAYRQMLDSMPELETRDIDAVISSYFSDHLNQQLCMSWIIQDYLGLSTKPGYRVESGGSTPMDAIINAYFLIKSGYYDLILVPGWEKMSEVDTAKTNEFIAAASDTDWDFTVGGYYNGYYAALEVRHMHLYGETEEDLHRIAVKDHNNAVVNPFSQWVSQHGTGKITVDDVWDSRLICWPALQEPQHRQHLGGSRRRPPGLGGGRQEVHGLPGLVRGSRPRHRLDAPRGQARQLGLEGPLP